MSQPNSLTDCETDAASNNTEFNEYSPDWHRGMHDSRNVSRAIAFLGSVGIKARPVSFDEAVELCLTKLKLVNGKAVQVPHYRIINVRHGLSGVRHYLDEIAEMGKRPPED